ncbi:MAG: DNA polymerase III subunit delta [Lachnospiraceae bacterium]|nr:DNA polymerase III subunit delta [Lachnospiraceae bacterium]
MRRILEDIRTGTFSHVYLLCGQEDYLRNQYKNKLKAALLGDGDQMNLSVYEGSGTNPLQVIDLAQTMPFLSDRRVMILENTGFFKGSQEALAAYMKEIPEFTYFVFAEKEVDKRSRMYKAVKENGHIAEFEEQDEATLRKWIAGRVAKEQKKMDMGTISFFLQRTGTDMENIEKELEKLFCYTLKKDAITREDIEEITTKQLSNRVFDMISFVSQKRQKEALKLYYDLLSLREAPMKILALMARQFNQLLQIKTLKDKGYDQRSIASKIGMQPFIVGKYWSQCNLFQTADLKAALSDCVQTDEDIKSGRINDTIGVELLLVKYSSASH